MAKTDFNRFEASPETTDHTDGLSRIWYYFFCALGLIYMFMQFALPVIEH